MKHETGADLALRIAPQTACRLRVGQTRTAKQVIWLCCPGEKSNHETFDAKTVCRYEEGFALYERK